MDKNQNMVFVVHSDYDRDIEVYSNYEEAYKEFERSLQYADSVLSVRKEETEEGYFFHRAKVLLFDEPGLLYLTPTEIQ